MLTPISFLAFTLLSVHQVFGWTTFVVPHNSSGGDDMPTLTAAFVSSNATTRDLAVNSTIIFKKGITYNFFSAIRLPVLQNVEIRIEGNMSYLEDIPALQAVVTAKGYPGAMMTFTGGTNVTLRGTTDREWGWIDGHGQAWWDAMEQTHRPHGIWFHNITGGTIRDMKIYKPVGWNYETTGSSNVHVFGNTILAKSDTDSFPFNTDGFGAQGTNQLFENNYVVNGDDCITITNGAVNITFRDAYCEGSHGLSTTIGSSSNNTFATGENLLFENVLMKSGLYGARFKSWTGGPGLTRNVTYRNIRFVDTVFPIYVTQNYFDQETGTRPVIPANPDPNNATHIEDFLFENFSGTIRDIGPKEGSCISDPCWFFVANATGREVVILDLYPGTATNVKTKNIVAHTESGGEVDVMCSTVDVTNDVGFICQDGAFIRTKAGI
ncbi:pectin lyase-like protein [Mycena albidolilacea]|uniref:galacturonan 1,4-alpha-galacturonidase n=1 Tax=Mycena albidolilacea TaxID=1033008 RepID=A0AAD6ZRT3_9AGAR|nr:pectin lyase-like protein [Mycena albidolilacea]